MYFNSIKHSRMSACIYECKQKLLNVNVFVLYVLFIQLTFLMRLPVKETKFSFGILLWSAHLLTNYVLAQAACSRHACLRAPCVAWPLLSPSFSLLLLLFFPPFFSFDPHRGIFHVRNNFSPNILA